MNNIYYVYIYLDTRKEGKYLYENLSFNYEPFYVGMGKNNRCFSGIKYGGSPYKKNKIKKIINNGFEIEIIKISKDIEFDNATKLEIDTISKIGRSDLDKGPLVNLTDGGEGTLNMSEESKIKKSKKLKGKKHSEETKEKMRKSRKKYFDNGNTTWNKGRQWTDEERKKLTNKSFSGRTFSEDHKKKLSINAKKQISEGKSIIKPKIVKKYDNNIFLKEYESIKLASIKNNIPASSIRSCCIKKLKHAGGFYWEFKK